MEAGRLASAKLAIAAMTGITVIAASPFSPPKQDVVGVSGNLGNYDFKPNWFELRYMGDATQSEGGRVVDRARKYMVTLSQTASGRAVHELQIMILVDNGSTLEGKVFVSQGHKFGTPEFTKERYKDDHSAGRGITWMQALVTEPPATSLHYLGEWHDSFKGAMSFGTLKNGQVGARIDLVIPGEHPCRVKGAFIAKLANSGSKP